LQNARFITIQSKILLFKQALRRIILENRDNPKLLAAELAREIRLLPDDFFGGEKEGVLGSVESVAYEALKNIMEHAYERAPRSLFACATVTPSGHFEDDSRLQHRFTTVEELEWLKENQEGMILEIAMADAGLGVPQTLWRNAEQKQRPFTAGWPSGGLDSESRRSAHQSLCEYAFHYDSTRKEDSEFPTVASRLSWRGLHKCLKQTEYLSGCILLASGQGRAGYVFVRNRIKAVSPARDLHADFPGTVVVLRFATSPRRVRPGLVTRSGQPLQQRVGYVASETDLRKGLPSERVTRILATNDEGLSKDPSNHEIRESLSKFSKQGPRALFVYFPFRNLETERDLLDLLPAIPPNHLAVLLFGHIPRKVRALLRADANPEWSPKTHGTPRLLCLWDQEGHRLEWQIAGEVPLPRAGQRVYADLELSGHAELKTESAEVQALARELANSYPEFIVWNKEKETLSFAGTEPTIAPEDFAAILDDSFATFYQQGGLDSFLFSCKKNEAVRIPTGRLVLLC
jgi:hypothetical protein